MSILILGTKSVGEDTEKYYREYVSFFQQAVTNSGMTCEISHALLDDLFIVVGDGRIAITDMRNNVELKGYQAVFIRGHLLDHIDTVKVVSVYLKSHGVTVVNDYSGFRSSSKLTQALQFVEAGLPVAQTVLVNNAVLRAAERLPFGFPCIMKAAVGSHGDYNYKVTSMPDVQKHLQEEPDRKFVLQRYMPNKADYRILLIGQEMLIIKRFATQNSHLNNTSQGGRAELIRANELPKKVLDQARAIVRQLGLVAAGVDVMFDESTLTYNFLEVNSQPQLMTGAFVKEKAKLVSEYLKTL